MQLDDLVLSCSAGCSGKRGIPVQRILCEVQREVQVSNHNEGFISRFQM